MSYYQLNEKEILQKAKDKYCKEKAVVFYLNSEENIKKK